MSAMKNLVTDTERQEMLYLCNAISQSRDEYREEMFRLREINAEMMKALKDAAKHCGVIPLDTLQRIIAKAESH